MYPHHFDANPDSTYGPDADPDSDYLFNEDPDPTFHPDADPDPNLSFKKRLKASKKSQNRLVFLHLGCKLMRIWFRIQLINVDAYSDFYVMRMLADRDL